VPNGTAPIRLPTGSADAIERQSSRPDFAGLFSAWIGSQKVADFHSSKKTPPIYIAHTEDDTTAKVAFTRDLEAALRMRDNADAGVLAAHALHVLWRESLMDRAIALPQNYPRSSNRLG